MSCPGSFSKDFTHNIVSQSVNFMIVSGVLLTMLTCSCTPFLHMLLVATSGCKKSKLFSKADAGRSEYPYLVECFSQR